MKPPRHYLTVVNRNPTTACGMRADIVFPGRQEAIGFHQQRRDGKHEMRSNGFDFETDPTQVTCKECRAALVETRSLYLQAEALPPPVTTIPVERRPILRRDEELDRLARAEYPVTDNRGEER